MGGYGAFPRAGPSPGCSEPVQLSPPVQHLWVLFYFLFRNHSSLLGALVVWTGCSTWCQHDQSLGFTSINQLLALDPIQPNESISGVFWNSGTEKLSPWDHGLGIMLVWRCLGPCCREVCWEENPHRGKGREGERSGDNFWATGSTMPDYKHPQTFDTNKFPSLFPPVWVGVPVISK